MAARISPSTPRIEEYAPADVVIPKRLGGGRLKEYVIRQMPSGRVIHYALAYINQHNCAVDKGRVLGYDNSHAHSHRHFMGRVYPDTFRGYEELYERFQAEWIEIASRYVNGESL